MLWHHSPVATLTDTHGFIKGLVQSGIPENQAEAIAEGLKLNMSDVATREDLTVLRRDIAELEARLTMRMATFVGVGVAVQSAIITAITLFA